MERTMRPTDLVLLTAAPLLSIAGAVEPFTAHKPAQLHDAEEPSK